MSRCLQLLSLLAPHVCANGAHDLYGNVLPNLAKEEIAVSAHGNLNDEIPTIELYKNKPVETRGAPPYPFPNTIRGRRERLRYVVRRLPEATPRKARELRERALS